MSLYGFGMIIDKLLLFKLFSAIAIDVTFDRELKPIFNDIVGWTENIKGKECWVFEGTYYIFKDSVEEN